MLRLTLEAWNEVGCHLAALVLKFVVKRAGRTKTGQAAKSKLRGAGLD